MLIKKSFLKKYDAYLIIVLALIFTLVNLPFISIIPFQINTDEIAHIYFARVNATQINPFAMSGYFYMPAADFILVAWLTKLLGGITIVNGRIINALVGIAIVIFAFLFFRLFSNKKISFIAACLLGFNHAFIAFNRMAVVHNHALLVEIIALFLLLKGVLDKSILYIYLGGLALGFSIYTYFPGRVTLFLWILLLLILFLYFKKYGFNFIFKAVALSLIGFIFVAGIVLVYSVNNSESATGYARAQILLFQEGRELQQEWVGAQTISEGIRKNITNGITAFNNQIHDLGYIYPNYNHGFLDPISGILIWFGFISLLLKRQKNEAETFIIGGFLLIWLGLSFLTTKNPNYGRLPVILPFSSYLITWAIDTLINLLKNIFKKNNINTVLATNYLTILMVLAIVCLNLTIFGDFVKKGWKEGNDVAGTGWFVQTRKDLPQYSFYLVADKQFPYYSWADEWQWRGWITIFASEKQNVTVLSPKDYISKLDKPPFSLFMSDKLWLQSETEFAAIYPNYQIYKIKPDGSLVAIEIK